MMQIAGVHATPYAAPSAPAGAGAPWDADDQALMELLLMESNETASPAKNAERNAAHATIDAKTKTKAKLTSNEKKARHREVVRRSYHRNKATVKVLQDEVKQLEDKFRELTAGRGPVDRERAVSSGLNPDELARIDAMKEQVASLDATSEQLRKESVKLQTVLLRHQEYARVVLEAFDDDLMEESTSEEEDDSVSSLASFSPSSLSDKDQSPVKTGGVKRALYAVRRPTHVVDLSQPAPIARDARKDIGFIPLTPIDTKLICNSTVNDIVSFTLSGRAVSTGARVLGWEDRRLIDGSAVRFSLRKPFNARSSLDLMVKTWQCFSDPMCTYDKFRGLMELRVLQRVNDDALVALRDTISPDNDKVYRFVYLLFRMRTTRGFLIGVKSINDPKFITQQYKQSFTRDGKEVQWVDSSGWFLFDRQGYVDHQTGMVVETGAEVEYGGYMDFGDAAHAVTLAMQTLSTALKWESLMVGPIFALPPSSSE